MKFNKVMTGLAVLMVAGSAMSAYAADAKQSTDTAEVTFTGAIVDTPCSLSGDSAKQTVDLGHVAKHVLQEGDKHSEARDFAFKLTNCTPDNKVTLTFQGPADPNDDSLLALGGGSASGAGIAILDQGKEVKVGDKTAQYQLSEGDNTLTFSAYVKGDGASEVTTGDFTSVATALFTYN